MHLNILTGGKAQKEAGDMRFNKELETILKKLGYEKAYSFVGVKIFSKKINSNDELGFGFISLPKGEAQNVFGYLNAKVNDLESKIYGADNREFLGFIFSKPLNSKLDDAYLDNFVSNVNEIELVNDCKLALEAMDSPVFFNSESKYEQARNCYLGFLYKISNGENVSEKDIKDRISAIDFMTSQMRFKFDNLLKFLR